MAKRKKEKVRPEKGMLVAIPLSDGTYGLAHIIRSFELPDGVFSIIWGFYDINTKNLEDLNPNHFPTGYFQNPVLVCSMDGEEFENGHWHIIGIYDGEYKNVEIDTRIRGRMQWLDGEEKPGVMLLEMYHGILPWDLLYDPNYLDKLLLPGFSRPQNVYFKK